MVGRGLLLFVTPLDVASAHWLSAQNNNHATEMTILSHHCDRTHLTDLTDTKTEANMCNFLEQSVDILI
jgi:hypothetical protein